MGLFNKKELQRISELEQQNTKLQKIIDDLGASDIIKINFVKYMPSNIMSIIFPIK